MSKQIQNIFRYAQRAAKFYYNDPLLFNWILVLVTVTVSKKRSSFCSSITEIGRDIG